MKTRRQFLQDTTFLAGGLFLTNNNALNNEWFMPDEADPHQRTWMAFGASAKIWGSELLPEVQRNLATIARTVAASAFRGA